MINANFCSVSVMVRSSIFTHTASCIKALPWKKETPMTPSEHFVQFY